MCPFTEQTVLISCSCRILTGSVSLRQSGAGSIRRRKRAGHGRYLAELKIFGNNRTGLLVDISKVFTERGIDIDSINSRTSKKGIATIVVSFYTKGKDELSMLSEKLRQIESVFEIERTTG